MESGVLFNDFESWTKVLDIITVQAKTTAWLKEENGMTIYTTVKRTDLSSELLQSCFKHLQDKHLIKSPEGVAIWLRVQESYPEFKSYPAGIWAHNDPLHHDNLAELSSAMRELSPSKTTVNGDHGQAKQGVWKQQLHFAWGVLFHYAIKRCVDSDGDKKSIKDFRKLWEILAENTLFSEKASPERMAWGFQLFCQMLFTSPAYVYEILFGPNFRASLAENCRNVDKILHKSAMSAIDQMKWVATQKPGVAYDMIKALGGQERSILVDRDTNTKILSELAAISDRSGFKKLLVDIEDAIRKPPVTTEDGERSAENVRSAAAEILRHGFCEKYRKSQTEKASISWTGPALIIFAKYAYCIPRSQDDSDEVATPEISATSRSMFHSKLSSCMSTILSSRPTDPEHWPFEVIHKIHKMTKKSKPLKLALDAEKEVQKGLKKAYEIVESIQDGNSKKVDKPLRQAMTLLFCLTLLQAYNGDPDAVAILDDLMSCYAAILAKDTSSSAYELLVEVLLSFVSKPSRLFRNMADEVFAAISAHLNETGLESLYEILRQSESLAGQQELFEEQASVASDEDELDSDVEMVDQDESSGESDAEEEENVEDDDELQRFEAVLAEALKTSKLTEEGESDSDSDGMDDDDMLAIEPKIAEVFRQRNLHNNKRKERQAARANVINFKRRVLDLLSIYIKHESTNPLCLSIIMPLVDLLRLTSDNSLQAKAANVLQSYYSLFSGKKGRASQLIANDAEDLKAAWNLLDNTHEEILSIAVKNAAPKQHGVACSRASIFAARMLLMQNKDNFEKIADKYDQTMRQWFGDKSRAVPATFFTEWISFCAEMRKNL
jgi:DNA polymerase phi